MSGIAGVFNVPGSVDELNTWSFTHAAHHRDINKEIFRLTNIVLPEFLLDPMDPDNKTWLRLHQNMHENQNAILGIKGFNLLNVDLTNHDQLAGFIYLNSNEHFQASNILGIG